MAAGDERESGVDKIAMHDVPSRIGCAPCREEALSHLTRDRLPAARAGLNNEKLSHRKFLSFGVDEQYTGCQ